MNCPDAQHWSDYLDGELRPREFEILRKHLASCEACASRLETQGDHDALLRAALGPKIDLQDFTAQVLRRLRDDDHDDNETLDPGAPEGAPPKPDMKGRPFMSKLRFMVGLALATILFSGQLLPAQDDAKSMLTAARKQAAEAKGLKGQERARVLDRAMNIFAKVPEQWPDALKEKATAWLEIASIHRRLGRLEDSVDAYSKVLLIEGQSVAQAKALSGRAAVFNRQKQFDDATRDLNRIIKDFEDQDRAVCKARYDLARLARRRRQLAEAIATAEQLLEAHPTFWRANVDAADLICQSLLDARRYKEATDRLAQLDQLLDKRFAQTEKWPSVQRAMQKMSSRKKLTPLPL